MILKQLSHLLALAKERHFGKAARQAGVSQPGLSASLKHLEDSLGVPLVHTQVGGKDSRRSELSELAQDLVRDFDDFRTRLFALVQDEFSSRLQATLQKHACG